MSYESTIDQLRRSGNFRSIPAGIRRGDDTAIVDLSLNDYLGLATRTDLQERFFADEANRRIAMTASAARLLAADQSEHRKLEDRLSELYGRRHALLFNSGYHANTGLISALASEPGTLVVADKLIHASIIDGLTLGKGPFQRFVHNDFDRLERILQKEHDRWQRIVVTVESVYSMDGDRTDLDALIALKRRYGNVMLYVDEAHSFGVVGRSGLGMCLSHPAFAEVDVVVGTFGKACASAGAFAITDKVIRDYAINRARSFIFSTALAPMTCAWTRFMLDNIVGMDAERQHLAALSRRLADGLGRSEARYITPYIVGSADRAMELSRRLLADGFKVLPIRTPTVPPGTERLRISLSAAMTAQQIDSFVDALNNACR